MHGGIARVEQVVAHESKDSQRCESFVGAKRHRKLGVCPGPFIGRKLSEVCA